MAESKDEEAKQQQQVVAEEEQGPDEAAAHEESSSSPLGTSDLSEESASAEGAGGQGDTRSRKQLWKAAIKLPMYSVAVVPLMVRSNQHVSFGLSLSSFKLLGITILQCSPAGGLLPLRKESFWKACSRRHEYQLNLCSCTIITGNNRAIPI